MIRGRELQGALPTVAPLPTPPAVPTYTPPSLPATPTVAPPVVATVAPPVATPAVVPPVVPPVASSASASAPAAAPDSTPANHDRFITSVSQAATYFEDLESNTRHLVRNGCQICDDPKPCENPLAVTDSYMASLTLGKDFDCDMMLNADVAQGVAPDLPTTSTPIPTTTMLAALPTTTTEPEAPLANSSLGFGQVAIVLVILVLCCVGAGAALNYFNRDSNKGRDKKGKGSSNGSAKKGKRRDQSDQSPLLAGQHAPTLDALSGQELDPRMQLPDTLQARVPMPPVPPMHLQRKPDHQEHAPTITSLQQMPQTLTTSESFVQMNPQPAHQLAPTAAALQQLPAPTITSMPQQQQQQLQQSSTALAPTTMALGQLPAELMSPQVAAAVAMPTTQGHNHYPAPSAAAALGQQIEYDVVTVTPDGFQVSPYAGAAQGAM
mmetsp:Transcript_128937/g.321618  ORF Transcript_128937/g.321618 Transcript_128937/m.321618 type:complete len:437 (+) Transcript_128937:84-1394(+)